MRKTKPTHYPRLGSISSGTVRPEDLITAFLSACDEIRLTRQERSTVARIRRDSNGGRHGSKQLRESYFLLQAQDDIEALSGILCCGQEDARILRETGEHGSLYLTRTGETWTVSNWLGTFKVPVNKVKRSGVLVFGRHKVQRVDAWFVWEGSHYHARSQGDMDICRVKRIKG